MRRKILLNLGFLSAALLTIPALYAQDVPGTEDNADKKNYAEMSDQELMEILNRSLQEASDGMDKLERELAKSSLPTRAIDERHAELEGMIEKLKAGSLEQLPEGIRKYFEEHTDKLAEALKVSEEEANRLLNKEDQLIQRLNESKDAVTKLLDNNDTREEVVRLQGDLERDLSGSLAAQEKLGATTRINMESALEAAYALRKQQTSDSPPSSSPSEQSGDSSQGEGQSGDKPSPPKTPGNQGARQGYNANGDKVDNDIGEEREVNKSIWDADRRTKEHERARGSEGSTPEPPRYKGMLKEFTEHAGKQVPKKEGEPDKTGSDK